jgi:hypothetical protein
LRQKPKTEVELNIKELNPDKLQITNYKHQITNKSQISNTIKNLFWGILNFDRCDLFVICVLLFEIFITATQTLTSKVLHFLQHVARKMA